MKKVFVILMFGLFLIAPITVAKESDGGVDEKLSIENPGILPDSPFYFFKITFEKLQLFLTLNKEKKILLEIKLSNKRLKEAEKLAEKGKTDLAIKHLENWQERVDKIVSKIEEQKSKGKDVQEIVKKLENNQIRQQEILQLISEKVSDNAKDAILKAKEKSQKGLENAMQRLKNRK